MSSDLNYWCDEYKKEVDQFKALVEKLKAVVGSSNMRAIESACKDCDLKAVRVREVKKSFGLEVKLVRDKATRRDFEEKGNAIDAEFDTLHKEFSQIKAANEKKDLFTVSSAPTYTTEGKNNDTLLSEANRIQDLTFESLARTKNMIEASKEIGTATVEQLRLQREQMIEIEREVDELDSNLVRAEKLLINFTKRMATDRIIQMFAAINIVVMLGLILYVAVSGRSLSMSQDGVSSIGPSMGRPTQRPTPSPNLSPSSFPTNAPSLQPLPSERRRKRRLRQF